MRHSAGCLLLIITLLTVLRPANVHLLVVIFDKLGNTSYLAIAEDASVLEHCITVAFHEKLCRASLGELAVAGMNVHTLNHAERRKIEIVSRHLKIVILRHGSVLHIFKVLLQVAAHD